MFKEILRYISVDKKYPILVALVAFLLTLPLVFSLRDLKGEDWWADWGDPLIGLATFFVAVGIWLGGLAKDWREQLPKKLTVKFLHNDKEVMTCHRAYLASVGDIRTWGQQIGAQMAGTKFLRFTPNILQAAPIINKDEKNGSYYNLYEATFYLSELPIPADHIPAIKRKAIIEKLATTGIHWDANIPLLDLPIIIEETVLDEA